MKKMLSVHIQEDKNNKGFNFHAMWYASHLNLNGFAKYEKDNLSYIELEGDEENINEFVRYCQGWCLTPVTLDANNA